jgi:antitoxin VapB
MSLTIKNERACRLIAELAELSGETQTAAVTHAVEEALERRRSVSKLERMRHLSEQMAAVLKDGPGSADIDELLCDERGMPK